MTWKKKVWRLNRVLHRDIGYFVSSLVIAYCLSGLALKHIDDWNPDFLIEREEVLLPRSLLAGEMTPERVTALSRLVGEAGYRVFDSPASGHLKIYYEDASLHVRLAEATGTYERIERRPLFYEVNVLHRNSFKPWRWGADVFAVLLILINLSGIFVLRGKNGFLGRGKWFIAAGFVPPITVLLLHG